MGVYVPLRLALLLLSLHLGHSQRYSVSHSESHSVFYNEYQSGNHIYQSNQNFQLSCRQCEGYHDRSYCRLATCPYNQMCATRAVRFDDGIKYWEFCVDSNNCHNENLNYASNHGGRELCGKCCSHSGCNAQLCDVNQHVNTYSCLSCSDADTLQDCNQHESCDENQICMVRAVLAGDSIKFYGGCVHNSDCNHDNLTYQNPHQGTHQLCGKCCHGDNCNKNLCEYTRHNDPHWTGQLSCQLCEGNRNRSFCGHEICDQGHQMCATQAVWFPDDIKYAASCVDSNSCHNEDLITNNHYGGRPLCAKCCSHSGCNAQLCDENQHVNTYSCLSCMGTDTLQDCTQHQSCDDNQTCMVRAVLAGDSIKFDGGCVPNSDCNHDNLTSHNHHNGTYQLCGKCCHGDNCNRDLCEYTRHNEHQLICRQCDGYHDKSQCGYETCQDHQMCATRAVRFDDGIKYWGYCVDRNSCDNEYVITGNHHGGTQLCAKCCSHSGCNTQLCDVNQHVHQLSCRQCDGYHNRSNCGYDTCHQDHQVCATRAVSFHDGIKYWEFCADSNSCHNDDLNTYNHHGGRQLCGKCCSHSGCNAQLCQHEHKLSCRRCDGYYHRSNCGHETCQDHQSCATRAVRFHDGIKYWEFCVDSDNCQNETLNYANNHGGRELCGKCCSHSGCNEQLCDVNQHVNTYSCLNCYGADTLQDCTQHESCDENHICVVRAVHAGHAIKFYGGCVQNNDCNHDNLTSHNPHQGTHQLCGKCCHGDNCNRDMCEYTRHHAQMSCAVCTGSKCGVTSGSDPVLTCPSSRPFCMTTVQNQNSGKRTVSKMCASETECNNKWWEQTMCVSFRPTSNYSFNFTCSHCCTTPGCNTHLYPDMSHLYTGTTTIPLIG